MARSLLITLPWIVLTAGGLTLPALEAGAAGPVAGTIALHTTDELVALAHYRGRSYTWYGPAPYYYNPPSVYYYGPPVAYAPPVYGYYGPPIVYYTPPPYAYAPPPAASYYSAPYYYAPRYGFGYDVGW